MFEFRFDTFTTSDGTRVQIPHAGVVIFVGPNNAGKSQSLKDLLGLVRGGQDYTGRTITSAEITKTGTAEEATEWARDHLSEVGRDGFRKVMVPGWGEVEAHDFGRQWMIPDQLQILTDTLILHADGTTRLTAGNAQPNMDFRSAHPAHPIQRAFRDPSLEGEFGTVSRAAFGLEATVDRYAGSVIPLRLGDRPSFVHKDGVPDLQYLDALSRVPPLEDQGDGVKSFMGLMIQLIAGSYQAILVDEPEAFLHPPQARMLGRMLAQRATDQQVFLATHSASILQGVMEAGASVTIVRLTRHGSVNQAAVLDDAALKELWADPLLRYSNVLDGLFYDAVVLCESDSDCRFYAAVRDTLYPEGEGLARRPALLFAQCGGKARLSVVIRALRAVNVPVVAIADFDVLREEPDVQRAYEALGGDWTSLAGSRNLLATALRSEAKSLRKTAAKDAILERLASCDEVLTPKDVEDLRGVLKVETGWDKVKRAGLAGVPQGNPYEAAERLLKELGKNALLVVPAGELERLVPAVSGHGPAWVNAVLARALHLAPPAEAAAFVRSLEAAARSVSDWDEVGVAGP